MALGIQSYKVFVKVDTNDCVVAINSNAFIYDFTDWIEIDSGMGDKYHHAQNHYLNNPIVDNRGIYRYKLVNNELVERSVAEMDADYVEPVIKQSNEERITELEAQNAMLMECLLEMSMVVYA